MGRLNLACAQISCMPGNIGSNLDKHLRFIMEARLKAVDILVFPELSLTDYLSAPDLRSLKRSIVSTEIAAIMNAAGSMAVSFGFIEAGEDGESYNAQALIYDGKVIHVHRKINLPTYGNLREGLCYAAGTRVELALVETTQAATLICADSYDPALTWLAALQGADLLLHPIASARSAVGGDFDNPGSWETNLRYIAMIYGLPIVMTNHCGTRGALDFWGGSRILDAYGHELVRAGEGEELVHATIETGDATLARKLLPTVRDSTPHLVATELGRVLCGLKEA
ncbi:nitrilase-related carbon-nitrogen hydrolase [Mesorhizobium silamurunense]|uniref:nitrilase-related carbon-nitrogen hydrolase n=1 Tax=Mesorhizobium silamurunense TaxID=499528 RepID=UPI002484B410|nr:nitrilase-related carbon-nitrogen hydrolase [Mesorhizobium silamurunense]